MCYHFEATWYFGVTDLALPPFSVDFHIGSIRCDLLWLEGSRCPWTSFLPLLPGEGLEAS